MANLHFNGKADAYLEWAIASNFQWLAPSDIGPDQVDLLMASKPASEVVIASQTKKLLLVKTLPDGDWAELAQAISLSDRPALDTTWSEFQPSLPTAVLGLMDAGLGSDWLRLNPSIKARTRVRTNAGTWQMYWDMQSPSSARAAPMPRVSHGAHVLSWLAGQPPYAGAGLDADQASRCPLILVNFPRQAVNDPSGRWLGRYALAGLDYMVEQALAIQAKRLVVNISWGPQTGPHDGSSLLESALGQRIAAATKNGLQVDIVLAAGNCRQSRAHAQFEASLGCTGLTWVIPPAIQAPPFLELWWPQGTDLTQVRVTVQAPHRQTFQMVGAGVASGQNAYLVILNHHPQNGSDRPMALLALNPTGDTAQAATHGRWQISVEGIEGVTGLVHAYVARQAANLGAPYRGPDSYLDDPNDGQQGFHRHPAPSPSASSLVSRRGTLSGLATAAHAQVYAAAGAVLSTGEAAVYSSEGPSASGGTSRPNWALPTDETPLLKGVLGAGSRPGSVVRLVGTSMAAPQLARMLLNRTLGSPTGGWNARLGWGVAHLGWKSRQRS